MVYDKRINGGKNNPNSKTLSYNNFTFPSDYEQDFGIYEAYHYANGVTSQIDDKNGHNNNNQIRANKDCTYHYDTNSHSIETICDGCHNSTINQIDGITIQISVLIHDVKTILQK